MKNVLTSISLLLCAQWRRRVQRPLKSQRPHKAFSNNNNVLNSEIRNSNTLQFINVERTHVDKSAAPSRRRFQEPLKLIGVMTPVATKGRLFSMKQVINARYIVFFTHMWLFCNFTFLNIRMRHISWLRKIRYKMYISVGSEFWHYAALCGRRKKRNFYHRVKYYFFVLTFLLRINLPILHLKYY